MNKFAVAAAAFVATAALVAGSVAPAYAADVAPKAAAKQINPAQRVCVRGDVLGSHISQTVCKTRAEWAKLGDEVAATAR